jgi:thioredoxin 2
MPEPSKIVACPNCATLNRVPLARLAGGGKCGRCGAALFAGSPVELNAGNFEAHAAKSDLPLVIDFWAGWCGPCRQMAPAFAAAAAQLEPEVRLGKLDTEAEPGLAARFDIRSIPTVVVVSHGRELARKPGAMPSGAIVGWVRQATASV